MSVQVTCSASHHLSTHGVALYKGYYFISERSESSDFTRPKSLKIIECAFIYMTLMHSNSLQYVALNTNSYNEHSKCA